MFKKTIIFQDDKSLMVTAKGTRSNGLKYKFIGAVRHTKNDHDSKVFFWKYMTYA